jgi:hypothetical protein
MPRVKLLKDEVVEGGLPPVCMVCGATAVVDVKRPFSWHPSWAVLFGVLVAVCLTKRRTVFAPMCERHRSYWSFRAAVTWLGFVAVVLAGVGAIVLMASLSGTPDQWLGALAFLVFALLFATWLVLVNQSRRTSIRCLEITDSTITLTGVSGIFVAAVETNIIIIEPHRNTKVRR